MRLLATVPATSANLGPGFDCFGIALDLCNEIVIDAEAKPGVTWEGEGADELPNDGSDMVGRAMAHAARVGGRALPALSRHGLNRIPLERGLGSSAAACVAGISLADKLLGLAFGARDVLELAAEIEGHADNAAAAIAGGLTLAFDDGLVRLDPHPDLRPVALVPDHVRLPTDVARKALRQEVTLADAVFNLGHAAAAVVAFTSQPGLLPEVLRDKLHQDARLELVPRVRRVFERLLAESIPVCVSGAGPTLLAFELEGQEVPDPGSGWRVLRLGVHSRGAEVSDVTNAMPPT